MSSSQYQRVPQNEEGIDMKDANSRTPPPKQEEQASKAMVVFSVSFYLVAAIVMVMVNKWVLNAIEIPLFFLFCQLIIAVVLLHICALFGYFKLPTLDYQTCRGLVPLISCNVLGLAFNTYCLQYVDASFYQVARGLVLPFTVFFSWFLLRTKSSPQTLVAVGIVCFGFLLGVSAERISVSTLGVVLGVASSVTTSVHAIVVKHSLPIVSGSTLDLVYYSNFLSAVVILPFVLISGEAFVVWDMATGAGDNAGALNTFLTGAAVTGVFGFLICIAGFLSIKVTSPISHMISAAVRGVLQTFLGIWVFGDVVSAGRGFGIVFILAGSVYYVYTKSQEQAAKPAPPPPADAVPRGGVTPNAVFTPSFEGEEDPAREKRGSGRVF
ncbi:hypothetical protein T439DRAFT_321024 [Meredithblackwellia eburnea MCA 4105]